MPKGLQSACLGYTFFFFLNLLYLLRIKLVLNYKHTIALMAYVWISLAVGKSLDKLTDTTVEGCQVMLLVAF